MELSKKNVKIILGIITFAVLLLSASQHLSVVADFLKGVIKIFMPIIVGLCIAFVLNVLMRVLETRVFGFLGRSRRPSLQKAQRPVSLVSTILITIGFIALLLLIIIPELRDAVILLVNRAPSYLATATEWIEGIIKRFELNINTDFLHNPRIDWQKVGTAVQHFFSFENTGDIVDTTVGVTSTVVSGFANFFLGFVIAVYVLAQKEKIGKFFHKLTAAILPPKAYAKGTEICTVAANSFSSFITGQFTDAALLGTMCFIGMTIFRFPSAAVVAVVIGITALIPVIGPIIGEAIGFIIIFMDNPLKAVLFLLFMIILQAIDNNFIYPRIVGKSVGLPGLIVLAAVIIGGNLGGIFGVLLGVPTASAIYALVLDWLNRRSVPEVVTDNDEQSEKESNDN